MYSSNTHQQRLLMKKRKHHFSFGKQSDEKKMSRYNSVYQRVTFQIHQIIIFYSPTNP